MVVRYAILALLPWYLAAAIAAADSPIRPGDRIAIVGNTFADQLRIHGYLEKLLRLRNRNAPVSIRNLGWGGDMLTARDRPTGFASEESTLTSHKTDVIIACFGMGESFAGETGIREFKTHLAALVDTHSGKKYNGKTEVRLILVSPNACENLGKLTPFRDKRNRDLLSYAKAMREVADEAEIAFIDLFEPSRYFMNEADGPKSTTNGIHLTSYGYWAMSHSFYQQLTADDEFPERSPWLIRIDAASKASEGRGVAVSELSAVDSDLSFQVNEKTAPTLGPPTDEALPAQLESSRDMLIVENLESGEYGLTIDEKPVATASAQEWSQGVPVDASPAHKSAEAFRIAVNDKNLQFTYRWKALNQVHIVDERRTSPSGKLLPAEVVEFDRLAKEREKSLGDRIDLKTRKWRLTIVSRQAAPQERK